MLLSTPSAFHCEPLIGHEGVELRVRRGAAGPVAIDVTVQITMVALLRALSAQPHEGGER